MNKTTKETAKRFWSEVAEMVREAPESEWTEEQERAHRAKWEGRE